MYHRVKPTKTESHGSGEKFRFREFSNSKCTSSFITISILFGPSKFSI